MNCRACASELPAGASICPVCQSPVESAGESWDKSGGAAAGAVGGWPSAGAAGMGGAAGAGAEPGAGFGYGPGPGPGMSGAYGPGAGANQISEDRLWSVAAHASLLLGLGIIIPLIAYVMKKDTSMVVRHHAAQALNFHITLAIAGFVSGVLMLVFIGILMIMVVIVWGLVLAIIASIAASKDEAYRYPLTIQFVS